MLIKRDEYIYRYIADKGFVSISSIQSARCAVISQVFLSERAGKLGPEWRLVPVSAGGMYRTGWSLQGFWGGIDPKIHETGVDRQVEEWAKYPILFVFMFKLNFIFAWEFRISRLRL